MRTSFVPCTFIVVTASYGSSKVDPCDLHYCLADQGGGVPNFT